MIDWATYGAAIARIVAESGNDYPLAAAKVQQQFGISIKPDSIRRQFQRMTKGRSDAKPKAPPPPIPPPPPPADTGITHEQLAEIIANVIKAHKPAPAVVASPVVPERFANPPGVNNGEAKSSWVMAYNEYVYLEKLIPGFPDEGCALIGSDMHVPLHHKGLVDAWIQVGHDNNPFVTILNGDIFDCPGFGHYLRPPGDGASFQSDLDAGRYIFEEAVKFSGPKGKPPHGVHVHYTLGNHELRIARFLMESGVLWGLRSLDFATLAQFPAGVMVHPDQTTLVMPDDFCVRHGDEPGKKYGGGKYPAVAAWNKHGESQVLGHHHRRHLWREDMGRKQYEVHVTGMMGISMNYMKEKWDRGFGFMRWWTDANKTRHVNFEQCTLKGDGIVCNGKLYRV